MIAFFVKFLFINILPSLSFLSILNIRLGKFLDKNEKIIISLAIGPIINLWLLNLLLLLFPHKYDLFYIFTLIIFAVLVVIINIKDLQSFFISTKKLKNTFIQSFFYIIPIIFFFATILFTSQRVLTGKDMLVYGTEGIVIGNNKAITYKYIPFDSNLKFMHKIKYGHNYSLFATLEHFYNKYLNSSNLLNFEVIPYYYFILLGLFLTTTLHRLLGKKYSKFSLFGIVFLITAPLVSEIFIMGGSIDFYRIFLLYLSYFILYFIYKDTNNRSTWILIGIILGLTANSHAIGLVSTIFCYISLFLLKGDLIQKIKNAVIVGIIIIIFGGFHYPLEIITGNGWIFQNYIREQNKSTEVKVEPLKQSSQHLDEYIEKHENIRNIDTTKKLIFNGYLSTFFRIEKIGIIGLFALPLIIIALLKSSKGIEKILLANYVILFIVIAVFGYRNTRYALTLLPFSIIITLYYLIKLFNRRFGTRTFSIIFTALTVLAFSNLFLAYAEILDDTRLQQKENKQISNSVKTNNGVTKSKNNVVVNTKNKLLRQEEKDLISYVKQLPLDQNESLIMTGNWLINYHTQIPTYYMSPDERIYTEEYTKGLCSNINKFTDLYSDYNIRYLINKKNLNKVDYCLPIYLSRYGSLAYESGNYQVFSIYGIND